MEDSYNRLIVWGLINNLKGQFLDVIEFEDVSNKILVYKFQRESGNNEIKQGSRVVVREGQEAIFLSRGRLADVLRPGTHVLNTNNMPILSSLKAFPFNFVSPIISDLYFVSTRQFIENKWTTKIPVMKRDSEFGMIRIRSFGKFAFRIVDPALFMREVFGSKGLVLTYEIIQYLSSVVTQSFAETIGENNVAALDLASNYTKFGDDVLTRANNVIEGLGIKFTSILVENISLPDEVEKLIDEQSGIGMAKNDMDNFMKYQSARAMRDAAKQKGGLAGLGAGAFLGSKMMENINNSSSDNQKSDKVSKLKELKELLDMDILTKEEFEIEKKKILGH